jgi:hypothetical protein
MRWLWAFSDSLARRGLQGRRLAAAARSGHIELMADKPSLPVSTADPARPPPDGAAGQKQPEPKKVPEIGGVKGPDPTRYGDWERNGRCIDF